MMVLPKRPRVSAAMRDEVEWQGEAIDRFASPAHSFLARQVRVDWVASAGFGECNAAQC